MAANVYECLFLLDSNHFSRDPQGTSKKIDETIAAAGGEVLASRLWTEQKLAYPVDGHRKGSYWLAYFRIESTKLAEFERACRLNESILRHLTIKIDPRLEGALVAHALGQNVAEEQPAAETATAS